MKLKVLKLIMIMKAKKILMMVIKMIQKNQNTSMIKTKKMVTKNSPMTI